MSNKNIKAVNALEEAQKIAFAPFLFQATISLKRLGIFDLIFDKRIVGGIGVEEIAKELELTNYGVGVLLEIAESSNVVEKNELGKYELTKIGYFLNFSKTAEVNMNFTQDVCYKGLHQMEASIKSGKPKGLKELGDWNTIYEGLSILPDTIKQAWFEFDHHYSDNVFQEALQIVLKNNPKTIFDIGGNTGKFAIACCEQNTEVAIKIIDLPGQLNVALQNVKNRHFDNRVSGYAIDWLSDNPKIPTGADTIWMSQFLDCFSKEEILKILKVCVASMEDDTELYIMETFTDRQKFDNAKFILEATSLYFTVLANGNSKMYKATEFEELIDLAGLKIVKDLMLVGDYHSIFICKKK